MPNRPNNQVEMRLVSEWLSLHRAQYWTQQRVRLGDLPDGVGSSAASDEERAYLRNSFARWADAIVELPDRTELIEAKIVAHPVALGQLELYARLLPMTPSLTHRRGLPVTPVLLYAVPDALVLQLAREKGIQLVQYRPPWVDEHLARHAGRKHRAPLPQALAGSQP